MIIGCRRFEISPLNYKHDSGCLVSNYIIMSNCLALNTSGRMMHTSTRYRLQLSILIVIVNNLCLF